LGEGTRYGLKKFGENYSQPNPPTLAVVSRELWRAESVEVWFGPHPAKVQGADVVRGKERLLACRLLDNDRKGTPPPRKARFTNDESMIEVARRGGGCRTLEDKKILVLMIARKSGEIALELTDNQYDKFRRA
jgi:hypothetical protein